MRRKAGDIPERAAVDATSASWLDWKQCCHRLLNTRMRESPHLVGVSQRGSLHAVLSVLLDHCKGHNQMPDGRLVCWPAIQSDEPGRGLREWLGFNDRYLSDLVGRLAALQVIEIQYSPKSSASYTRHTGSLVIKGVQRTIGRCNAYFIAVPYVGTAADDASVVMAPAGPPVVERPAPRPVPMRPRAPKAAPWYRVGKLPDLPKPLREEWDRTLGREKVTEYLQWLAETWGERRTDVEAFAFHKKERVVWTQQRAAAHRGIDQQQRETDTHQQVQARLAKRAEAHG